MAKSSYGIECAMLAGLPDEILEKARARSIAMEDLVSRRQSSHKYVHIFPKAWHEVMTYGAEMASKVAGNDQACPEAHFRSSAFRWCP
jgi:DNA mismatch repair ATPase MutS